MMTFARSAQTAVCLAMAALALAGCSEDKTSASPDKPQAALTVPGSGGRGESASPAASSAPAASPSATTAGIDFGDDASKFARDGECDDKRFSGPGMTDTPLLDSDVGHDATDCRAAFNQKRLTFGAAPAVASSREGIDRIQWGDDGGDYAKDGECDDKRFTGPGMTSTPLLDEDIKHDATDCRAAYAQGRLSLRE